MIKVIRFALFLKRSGFDVCHLIFPDSSIIFPVPLRMAGLQVVVWRRDLGHWYSAVNIPILRLNRFMIEMYIANSNAVAETVRTGEGVPRRKIRVIYNGVTKVPNREGSRADDSSILEAGNRSISLVLVANLRPLKRVADAIRAMRWVLDHDQDVTLTVFGADRQGVTTPSHRSELESIAEDLGVLNKIEFRGGVTNARQYLHYHSTCLLCSESEGFSNSLLEYLAEGCAVIVSNVGGNSEVITHGVTGYLYPTGDWRRLAELILLTSRDREATRRIQTNAKRVASDKYSIENMVRAHEQAYLSL